MAIVRWDPFRELRHEVARDFASPWIAWPQWFRSFGPDEEEGMTEAAWVPPVDVYETDGGLVVKAELPGMKREDIEVTVENDRLSIRGQRKREREVEADRAYRIERSYGEFSRSFTLPSAVDSSKVQAEYKDGTLTITLPMRDEARPRQIPVNAAA